MEKGMLIITASAADFRLANRVLTWLKNWEYESDPIVDFNVLRTRNERPRNVESKDDFPLRELTVNEWEGLSIAEVESIMLQRERDTPPENRGANHLFLLLDNMGVQDQTIIVAERACFVTEDDEIHYLEHYNKVRVPWIEACSMWCNLDTANMGFDECCFKHSHEDVTDFWWHLRPIMEEGHYDQYRNQAEAAVEELEELDLAGEDINQSFNEPEGAARCDLTRWSLIPRIGDVNRTSA